MGAERASRRVVRGYQVFQVLFSLLFWVPVHYEFQRRIGLDDERIFAIQSLYYLAFCLLELPTGLFADAIGHLRSMKAGAVALLACNLLPVALPTDAGMVSHFLLLALARSFVSGASSAYLYGRLDEVGDASRFDLVEGRARAYGLVAKVASWAAVGFLIEWEPRAPYAATALASLGAVAAAWVLPAGGDGARRAPRRRVELGGALGALRATPLLGVVMVQGVALFVLGRVVQTNLFQPILGARAYPVEAYGVVMAAMAAIEALGSGKPELVRRYASKLDAVFALSLATAVSLVIVALSGPVGTAIGLALFAYATGAAYPIQRQLVVETIPDGRYRATLLSLESIVDRGVNAWVVAYLAGFVAGGRVAELLWICAGATVAVVVATQLVARRLLARSKPLRAAAPSVHDEGSMRRGPR